jgi:hypothetical protein
VSALYFFGLVVIGLVIMFKTAPGEGASLTLPFRPGHQESLFVFAETGKIWS